MVFGLINGIKGKRSYSQRSLNHLRDMTHNLPFQLNLDKEEAHFLHNLLSVLDRVGEPFHVKEVVECSNLDALMERYVGSPVSDDSSGSLTAYDFEKVKTSHGFESAEVASLKLLKIGRCVLFNNRYRYQNDDSHKKIPLISLDDQPLSKKNKHRSEFDCFITEYMKSLSDMLKNIPAHLNLDLEETKYLYYLFSVLDRLNSR